MGKAKSDLTSGMVLYPWPLQAESAVNPKRAEEVRLVLIASTHKPIRGIKRLRRPSDLP